jgi:hypothetical protein
MISSQEVAAEMSGTLLAPEVNRLARPLEIASPAAPAIRNKRLNIYHEGIRPLKPVKGPYGRLKIAVDVDEGGSENKGLCSAAS